MKSAVTLFFKEVKQNIVAVLLIILAVFLCISVVSGMFLYTFSMKSSAEEYFDTNKMWDLKITSSLGFTKEDVIAVTAADGVEKATAVISANSNCAINSVGNFGTYICGVDFDAISVNPDNFVAAPRIIKGSYPSNANSCIVIVSNGLNSDIKVGDVISLNNNTGYCTQTEFTVTGLAYSPEFASYLKRENQVNVNGTEVVIFVSTDAFSPETPYSEINVTLKNASEIMSFSRDYTLFVNTAMGPINIVARDREQKRGTGLSDDVLSDIDKLFKQYGHIKAQGDKELENLDKIIKNMQKSIDSDTKSLETQKNDLDTLKISLDASSGLPEYDNKLKEYNEKLLKYQSGFETNEMNKQTCEKLRIDYNDLKKTYDKKAEEAYKNYENAKNNQSTEYAQNWTMHTRDSNSGYVVIRENIGVFSGIFAIIPFVIIILSALLIVAAVVINMQMLKTEVYLLKLAGYQEKYCIKRIIPVYAAAVLVGLILSFVDIGTTPKVLSEILGLTFDFRISSATALPYITLTVGLILCFVSIASVWVFFKMLYRKDSEGMIYDYEKNLKKIDLFQKFRKLPVFLKVALRNIISNKFSFLYGIVAIMCTTVLLFSGYNIANRENNVYHNQYKKIQNYDTEVQLKPFVKPQENEAFMTFVSDKEYITVMKKSAVISVGEQKDTITAVIPVSAEKFSLFVSLKSKVLGKPLEFGSDSIIITEGFAESHSVRVGEEISVSLENGKETKVTVNGICRNYLGEFIYIHPEKYTALTGVAPTENTVFIKSCYDDSAAEFELFKTDIVYSVDNSSEKESKATYNYSKIITTTAIIFGVLILGIEFFILYKKRNEQIKALKFGGFGFLNTCLQLGSEVVVMWFIGTFLGAILGVLINIPIALFTFVGINLGSFVSVNALLKTLVVSLDIALISFAVNLIFRYKKTDRCK